MKLNVVTAVVVFFVSCSPRINRSYMPLNKDSFDKQGHRGCRGLMPENTVPAFIHAINLGVTTLEMDVVITKDKQVILSHEPFFNHEITTKPNGDTVAAAQERMLNIYQMNYDEVRKYDVGIKPHPRFPMQQKMHAYKPLLGEVIDSVKQTMMTRRRPFPLFNIETKTAAETDSMYHPAPSEFVELMMAVIREKGVEDFVIIQSFDIRTLQYLHTNYPQVKASLLIEGFDKKTFALQLKALGFLPTVYSPAYELVTPLLVKQCHDAGIQLTPWTVNDKSKIKELKNLGVDGIITDYPGLFFED